MSKKMFAFSLREVEFQCRTRVPTVKKITNFCVNRFCAEIFVITYTKNVYAGASEAIIL
jgi:hypothetical protein